MTSEQEHMFRLRLAGAPVPVVPRSAPAPDMPIPMTGTAVDPNANDFIPRTRASLGRLYDNPAIQGIGRMADPTGVNGLALRGIEGLSAPGVRQPTDFTREMEGGPQHMTLQPMAAGPELTLPNTPTLDQHNSAQATGRSGGGGSFGGGGMSLAGRSKEARENLSRTVDGQRDLVERGGELKAEKIDKQAELDELMAARKQRDAEVMAEHQAKANAKHEAFLKRNQELADQIGNEKIDPSQVMANKGMGEKLSMLIAGMLNGAAGTGPQYMARLDNMVSEGVKAQMANIDNQKAKLSARQNLFGQMMAESGDRRVAEMQTHNLMMESVKQSIGARAARLGIPEVTNNAQLSMNEIEQKQNERQIQTADANLRAQQAAEAAAANARRAAEEKAWSRSMQVADMALKKDAQDIERSKVGGIDAKDDNERFVTTGQDSEKNPTGYLSRNATTAAKEEGQRKSTEKLLGLVEEAQKLRNEQGTSGRIATAANPAHMVGAYQAPWESKMKILRGRMTGAIKEAEALGTLDKGSQAFADALTGGDDLTAIGGRADDQLSAFRDSLNAGKKTDESGSGGARATRIVDPRTGRERVVITGSPNAPRAEMPDSVKKR